MKRMGFVVVGCLLTASAALAQNEVRQPRGPQDGEQRRSEVRERADGPAKARQGQRDAAVRGDQDRGPQAGQADRRGRGAQGWQGQRGWREPGHRYFKQRMWHYLRTHPEALQRLERRLHGPRGAGFGGRGDFAGPNGRGGQFDQQRGPQQRRGPGGPGGGPGAGFGPGAGPAAGPGSGPGFGPGRGGADARGRTGQPQGMGMGAGPGGPMAGPMGPGGRGPGARGPGAGRPGGGGPGMTGGMAPQGRGGPRDTEPAGPR